MFAFAFKHKWISINEKHNKYFKDNYHMKNIEKLLLINIIVIEWN